MSMYQRWLMKIAHSDYPCAGPSLGYALAIYNSRRVILTSFLVLFPICLLVFIPTIPELTDYDLFAGIAAKSFLLWLLILWFTVAWWLWYRRKCDKVANREDVRKVKASMKRMLRISPYYLCIHVLCLLFFNMLLLTHVKFAPIPVAVLLIGDIWIVYTISAAWIRMVAYPLRSHIIREILESQKTA